MVNLKADGALTSLRLVIKNQHENIKAVWMPSNVSLKINSCQLKGLIVYQCRGGTEHLFCHYPDHDRWLSPDD